FWFSWIAVFLISVLGQTMESAAGSIYAMEEVQGLDALMAEEGFKGSFQTSTNMVDTSASTGWTYDSANKLYKNATGAPGANADQDYTIEANYEYYAESGSSATVSGNTVTISGATRDGGAGSPTWVAVTMGPVVNLADGRTARWGWRVDGDAERSLKCKSPSIPLC
ncbi:MAG: hypothetical protein HZA02_09005, partial [Nitrospinae bacterium]|nr:hypothetical protein [Nitrospinota bacterium]